MADRSKRTVRKHGQSKAAGALAQLAELRRTGKKQADLYELKEEEDLYDEVDEDEYAKRIAKEREEGDGFVVDDGISGYDELDEEEDDFSDDDAAELEHRPKKAKVEKQKPAEKKGPKRKAESPAKGDKNRIGRMFAKHTGVAGNTAARNDAHTGQASDALLDDILGDLGGAVPKPPPAQEALTAIRSHHEAPSLPSQPVHTSQASHKAMAARGRDNPFKKKPQKQSMLSNPLLATENAAEPSWEELDTCQEMPDGQDQDMEEGPQDQVPEPASGQEADLEPVNETPNAPVADSHQATASETPGENPAKSHLLEQLRSAEGAAITPKGRLQELKAEGKTPWKTPPPVFSEPETPLTAVPASGWQQHCDEEDTNVAVQEEETEWHDDGSLPLDDTGSLPFYFLDAHEEPSTPEIVYMFGKVKLDGSFLSCCARVKCPPRTVFFVPKLGLIPEDDLELTELQEAAKSDPSQHGALLRHVHGLLSEAKAEIRSVLSQHGISNFVIKPVMRNYAFELASIPRGMQWVLKVKYPSTARTLPLGLTGTSFVAVLGAEQSSLEAVMLKRKIMGPSWLSISKPVRIDVQAQISWSRLEVEIASPKSVSPVPGDTAAPPIVVVALSLKTAINSAAGTNEIAAASCVYLRNVRADRGMSQAEWNNSQSLRHFSVVRKLDGRPFPPGFEERARKINESVVGKRNGGTMVSTQGSERALLAFLLAKLQELDADVYTGHNISGFDIDVLLHRLQAHKMPHWSRLGRLKRSKMPNLTGGGHAYGGGAGPGVLAVLAGRMLCDTYLAARDLVKEVDYTLKTLARSLLDQERHELSATDLPAKYESSQKLMELIQHAESDAWLSLGLSFYLNFLPLTLQLSQLSGSLWSKALQGQRAQRIEMLLLHEFHRQKFLLPDKLRAKDRERLAKAAAALVEPKSEDNVDDEQEKPDAKKGKGPQYAGGLVLEPKKGLYDKFVLLLDFNSLYPSIIQEYNICFTTVAQSSDGQPTSLPQPSSDLAPLPKVIQQLVRRRRSVKDGLKRERDPLKRAQMEIRQQALKLTANSMYGCLGFTHSRFYARPLAELITGQGREILQSTVDLVQSSIGAEVIYGDTDSIMVASASTNLEEVRSLGLRIKQEVNKRYKLLEIEIDGVYKCMLLLKKKKYAAVKLEVSPDGSVHQVVEQKGLDIVRRDWCPLSKDVGNFALEKILSGLAPEDVVSEVHAKLQEVREKMDKGLIPLHKFIITKQLTKRPEDYPDAHNQPHVQVALRRSKAFKKDGVAQGETVPYIICAERTEDGQALKETSKGIAERAHHPEELRDNKSLTVDAAYYLANQVHPVISRMCAPIEGTDAAHLADCLGLDPTKFRGQTTSNTGEELREEALLSSASVFDDDVLYKDCEPLVLKNSEGDEWEFQGVQKVADGTSHPDSLLVPPHAIGSDLGLTPAQLANQVQKQMRRQIAKYYDSCMRSDDELQLQESRNISSRSQGDSGPGSLQWDPKSTVQLSQIYPEASLYRQIAHYGRLLNPDQALLRVKDTVKREDAAREMAAIRPALEAASACVAATQSKASYRWVTMRDVCV